MTRLKPKPKPQQRPPELDSHRELEFLVLWNAYAPEYPLSFDLESRLLPWVGSGRKFKADFIHHDSKIIVEIQGFGHQRENKYYRDMVKLAIAQINGWACIQIPADDIRSFVPLVRRLIEARSDGSKVVKFELPTTGEARPKVTRSRKLVNPF